MLSITDFLAAMIKECDICIHLHGKIPDDGMDYRPSTAQRSTLELLRYISFCGVGFCHALLEGGWDAYSKLAAESERLDPKDFPAAMETQKAQLRKLLSGVDEAELESKDVQLPSGETMKLGRALLDMPFRCLSGYRMQLFLYAKAAGNHDLKTPNCWAGVDMDF